MLSTHVIMPQQTLADVASFVGFVALLTLLRGCWLALLNVLPLLAWNAKSLIERVL